ncbi:MAG: isoprenylcysteine carboxylmethyltransferase family protein [bacterium]
MNFTIFFIIIIIIICIQRIMETFLSDKKKIAGNIYAEWTFPALLFAYILLIISSIIEYFVIKREINLIISGIGCIMVVIRILLKHWAIKSLDKYWSAHIEIRQSHKLIKEGPYKYLRHPAYLSGIIEFLAIPLIPNSYYTLGMTFIIYTSIILLRINIEEKQLVKRFGDAYIEYQKEVWALLPIKKRKKIRQI